MTKVWNVPHFCFFEVNYNVDSVTAESMSIPDQREYIRVTMGSHDGNDSQSLFDTFFLALALIALAVLLSILAAAIIGGLIGGAVAGGALGTPGLIISMGALVLLLAALTALVLDQTSH